MKKIVSIFLSILCCFSFLNLSIHANRDFPQLRSDHAIVINLNEDRALYEKASDQRIYPASMTKIMTTLVAIENIEDLNATYTFNNDFFPYLLEQDASVAGFQPGQTVSMQDLLYGILLPSGADATLAVANALFGSEDAFVEKMNKKAKKLGLNATHFMNTSGLHDDNHYSTVSDIATVLKYALKNETFKTIFTTSNYVTSDGSLIFISTVFKQGYSISQDTSMILGGKTGFTNEASLCLASYAKQGEDEFIMVSAQTHSDSSYPYHVEDAG